MRSDSKQEWSDWAPTGHECTVMSGPGDRPFDLMVYSPPGQAPEGGWPCLLVLDGGRYFGAFTAVASSLRGRPEKTGIGPMAIAAIGHRAEGGALQDQRRRDFPSGTSAEAPLVDDEGQGAVFCAWLTEAVLPQLAAKGCNPRAISLFGHSLAGLFVLQALERDPGLFRRWVSISPSLWWATPDPQHGADQLMIGCGEAEILRDMRGRISHWAALRPEARFKLAPEADHGSAPFALIPAILRFVSGN